MNKIEMINSSLSLLVIMLVIILVVQWVVIVNHKKEKDNLVKWLDWYRDKLTSTNKELEEYKIREEAPIPFVPNIDYLILKEEVKRYKPPYEVGQKVMYNDEGIVQVGYINSVITEQYESMNGGTKQKEVVVKHAYEIEDNFYTDIIDVVKGDKE